MQPTPARPQSHFVPPGGNIERSHLVSPNLSALFLVDEDSEIPVLPDLKREVSRSVDSYRRSDVPCHDFSMAHLIAPRLECSCPESPLVTSGWCTQLTLSDCRCQLGTSASLSQLAFAGVNRATCHEPPASLKTARADEVVPSMMKPGTVVPLTVTASNQPALTALK